MNIARLLRDSLLATSAYRTAERLGMHRPGLARQVIGYDDASKGAPLVHVRCGGCGSRVATVEDHDGSVMTFWRSRRFPGVPNLECGACGSLALDVGRLKDTAARARHAGTPRTIRAALRAQRG